MRLEQAAPIAGALVDRGHLGSRHLLEVIEREAGFAVRAVAADREPPLRCVDLRDIGHVVADEKRIVRRERRAEIFERRFIIRRPVGQLYERLLARQRVHDDFAARSLRQRSGQIRHGRFGREQAWKDRVAAGESHSRARSFEQISA
jgi:hypothetical protein